MVMKKTKDEYNLMKLLPLKKAASTRYLSTPMSQRLKPKWKNLRKKGKTKGENRISELPDEILASIVFLLPLKEAAATSILSKRWRYVWRSTPTLNFDVKYFCVGQDYHLLTLELKKLERRRYMNWVNTVVEQHTAPSVERFRVRFDGNCRFTNSIDKWIEFAMNKRVQILELDLILGYSYEKAYSFPHNLLGLRTESASKLKHVPSDIPSLRSCGYCIGFKFLKVLYFRFVRVTGEVLEYFLYNCPLLERLTVDCASKTLVNLRVVGPSVALKHLTIKHCGYLKSIVICDANLVSFNYRGHEIDQLALKNVPMLVEVSMSGTLGRPFRDDEEFYFTSLERPLTQLKCCLSQLEVLKLDIHGAVYDPNLELAILANLKHLELMVQADNHLVLSHLTSFLKASPYLRRLVLKTEYGLSFERGIQLEIAAKCPHHCLKVVEIQGYRARKCAVEHVKHLTKNVVALEKIVIDPVRRWIYRTEKRGVKEAKEEGKAREHAMQHLKEKVPSTVEFVCL